MNDGRTDERADGRDDERRAPLTDVFGLVAQETRAAILTVLAGHARDDPEEPGLAFSTLRRRVGHDDPGNFNYHLRRLVGGPVERTDAGYRLSSVGQRLVGTALSGRFDPDASADVETETACPVCGETATVRYADGALRVECVGHGAVLDVGPEVVESHGVTAACRFGLTRGSFDTHAARAGVCPTCEGPTDGGLVERGDEDRRVVYEAACRRCGTRVSNTPAGCVLDHPAVVSVCWDHGIDAREDGWRVMADHAHSELIADEEADSRRVAVTVAVGGDTVRLELDETGSVVETTEP